MPRYFFDFSEGELTSQDEEGLDLPDLAHAKSEAVATLPDLVRENRTLGAGWTIRCLRRWAGRCCGGRQGQRMRLTRC